MSHIKTCECVVYHGINMQRSNRARQTHGAGQAERRAVLHLQERQVQRRAGVDGRVVRAALDAALQVPLGQDPQGAPGRRALRDSIYTLRTPDDNPLEVV